MNLFKDLPIGKKLSLSFGFLFLVVLLLGIFWQRGLVNLKDIEAKKTGLIELKEKLREMQVVHYQWVDTLRETVRKGVKFEGELDPRECVFGKWYYSYKLPYPDLEESFKALEEPHRRLHQSGVSVLRAVQKGNMAEAERLSLQTRDNFLPALMKVYDPFLKGIGDVYGKYKLESDRTIARQKLVSKGIIGISLIFVVVLAVVMTRGIVRPLKRVTDTAHKIAEGDIPDVSQIETRESGNEITQLENAFARMAISLNDMASTADKIASGDLDAAVTIRSDRDVLANAIAKMVENLKRSVDELHTNSMNLALGMSDYFNIISEFSTGRLDVKASEETGDDLLDQLGKVTNNMIAEYKKLSECIEEVRQGNLDVKVHIRSDMDVLGTGFEHMLEHLRDTSEQLHTNSMNLAMGLTDYFMIFQEVAAGNLTVNASENTGDDLLDQLGKATNVMISSLKDLSVRVREQGIF